MTHLRHNTPVFNAILEENKGHLSPALLAVIEELYHAKLDLERKLYWMNEHVDRLSDRICKLEPDKEKDECKPSGITTAKMPPPPQGQDVV